MKKQFVYFREFSKNNELNFDFSKITLKERLFFSAILTKVRQNDERDLGQIIFDYNGSRTGSNFASYDNVNTNMIMKEYGKVFDYIKVNANKKTEKNWKIHAINIDIDKIFLTRNGHTSNSMNAISCKTFALGAASSRCCEEEWRSFNIYDWCEIGDKVDRKTLNTRKTKIKARIKKWLDEVGIDAYFENDLCVVKGMKKIVAKKDRIEDEVKVKEVKPKAVKETKVELTDTEPDRQIAEYQEKTMKEIEEKSNVIEDEYDEEKFDKPNELVEDAKIDKMDMVEMIKKYDDSYQRFTERVGFKKNQKIIQMTNKEFNFFEAEKKIAESYGLNHDKLMKYYNTRFIDGDNKKAMLIKKELYADLVKLKNHVQTLAKIDDSWCPTNNTTFWQNFLLAYVCHNRPQIMMIDLQ